MNEKAPRIGKSYFEESGISAIELFVSQVTKACKESGDPLPSIVKNYKKGDDCLYRSSEKITQGEFDLVNNNTNERELDA